MPVEMEMPNDFETGGAFLQEPGTYHLSVTEIDEQPQSNKGELLNGFRVDVEVVPGAGRQEKKQAELMFFNPKPTDKNGGEMAKKKQARFVLATGLLAAAKPGEKVTVDLKQARGRQFIATLEKRKAQNSDKEFIDLNFADIWHVDDPAAPKCELSQAALKLLPATIRRKPESFKAAAAGNGSTKPANTPAAPAAATSTLDEL